MSSSMSLNFTLKSIKKSRNFYQQAKNSKRANRFKKTAQESLTYLGTNSKPISKSQKKTNIFL